MTNIIDWTVPLLIFLVVTVLFFIIKKFSFSFLQKWASQTDIKWDDILVASANVPSNYLIVVLSLWIAQFFVSLPEKISSLVPHAVRFLIIVAVLIFIDRFLKAMIELYSKKNSAFEGS